MQTTSSFGFTTFNPAKLHQQISTLDIGDAKQLVEEEQLETGYDPYQLGGFALSLQSDIFKVQNFGQNGAKKLLITNDDGKKSQVVSVSPKSIKVSDSGNGSSATVKRVFKPSAAGEDGPVSITPKVSTIVRQSRQSEGGK